MKGALSWPFLRLYLLTLLYFSANAILNVIIPLKGQALGASNSTIGIVMGAYMLTTMILRPWAGQVIHRYGPIRILRIILTVNGIALLLYTFTGIGGYFFARILQGVCTAFFSMALQLGIIDTLPEQDRSQGISMYSLCSYIPGIIGPLLAIGIWQTGEVSLFAITMIALAGLTGLVGFTANMEQQPAEDGGRNAGLGMLKAANHLIHNPHLFRSSTLMLGASLVFGAVTTFVPLYALQITQASAGIFFMLQASVVVAVRFLLKSKIPSDGKWRSSFMVGTVLIFVTASLCISFASTAGVILFYSGALLMGIAQALLYPTLMTYLSFVLPKNDRNVLIGLFIAMADLGISLGGIVMGPIADMTSYAMMFMICAAIGAVMMLIAYDRKEKLGKDSSISMS